MSKKKKKPGRVRKCKRKFPCSFCGFRSDSLSEATVRSRRAQKLEHIIKTVMRYNGNVAKRRNAWIVAKMKSFQRHLMR